MALTGYLLGCAGYDPLSFVRCSDRNGKLGMSVSEECSVRLRVFNVGAEHYL